MKSLEVYIFSSFLKRKYQGLIVINIIIENINKPFLVNLLLNYSEFIQINTLSLRAFT